MRIRQVSKARLGNNREELIPAAGRLGSKPILSPLLRRRSHEEKNCFHFYCLTLVLAACGVEIRCPSQALPRLQAAPAMDGVRDE